MGDKRINDPQPTRENDEATSRLREHAFDPRQTGLERIERTADSGDRAAFRDLAAGELRSMRDNLRGASNAMSDINERAAAGQLDRGPALTQEIQKAGALYEKAAQEADKRLYVTNPDGTLKIDPATGRPQESDFLKRVNQERQLVSQEIDALKAIQNQGRRELTREEMTKLGVTSSSVDQVLMDRQKADLMLQDVQRSAAYARANYGLALVRASAGRSETDQQQQLAAGHQLLEIAAAMDQKMMGPPPDRNFEKNYRTVMKVATGQDVQLPSTDTGAPARSSEVPGVARTITDGNFRLPTGDVATDSEAFRGKNPFEILAATEKSIESPLSAANKAGFIAAIDAADSIDRVRLGQKMQAEQAYIDRILATQEPGSRIRSVLQTVEQENAKMDRFQAAMAAAHPDLVKSGGQELLDKLRAPKIGPNGQPLLDAAGNPRPTVESIEDYARFRQENAELVRKFESMSKGAEYLSNLGQFFNSAKIVAESEKVIAGLDPKFVEAQKGLAQDKILYHSSEDARAHFIRALIRDQKNDTPENREEAQKRMQQLAAINPNLLGDKEFTDIATFLGMKPDGKGGIEVAKGGDAPAPQAADTLTEQNVASISRAYDAYSKVMQKQPPSLDANDQAAFAQAIQDASKISVSQVQERRRLLTNELTQKLGWTEGHEQQYQGLNQAVGQAFAKIPEAQRTQITQIQDQLGRITSTDATAQQQRQNLEGQLQQLGANDTNVKAWLDARVQLANFYKTNPELVNARMNYEQADMNLQALEHAKAISQGLYGAALSATGDATMKQQARPLLVNAARDQVALQLAPEIAQAIQGTGEAQAIMQEAQRAGDPGTELPAEKPQGTDGAPAAAAPQNVEAYQRAGQSLAQSMEALKQVQENGQPLPANLKQIFENAVNLNKQIDPAQLETLKNDLKTRLLTGWTEQQEQQYKQVNTQVIQAAAAISPQSKQAMEQFQATLNPQDPNAQTAINNKLNELAAADPTVKAFLEARNAVGTFYQQNPMAANRDQYEEALSQLNTLQHGKGVAETLYAAALASTGNAADKEVAKTTMQSAMQDQKLFEAFPQAQEVATQLGLYKSKEMEELEKMPGFLKLREAEQIMADKSLTPQQRIEKAGPKYAEGVEETKKIRINDMDERLKTIGTRLGEIETEAEGAKDNPVKMQELRTEYQKLAADADKLGSARLFPMQARLMEAVAYNSAAAELYAQAEAGKGDKQELMRTANEYNKHAAATLKGLEQVDPRLYNENPTVKGAIQQIEQHKLIDPKAAAAIGSVLNVEGGARTNIFGPGMGRNNDIQFAPGAGAVENTIGTIGQVGARGIQPLWTGMNIAGDVLQTGNLPVISWMGAGLSRAEEQRPGVARALALAKYKDQAAADGTVSSIRHNLLNQGTYIVSDLGSAYLGMYGGKAAAQLAARRFGPAGQFVAFAVGGLATTTATNKLADVGAHKLLGTDMRDDAEILTRSAMSFGMTWGLQGLANARTANANAFAHETSLTHTFRNGAAGEVAVPRTFAHNFDVWSVQPAFNPALGKLTHAAGEMAVPKALETNFAKIAPEHHTAVMDKMFKAAGGVEKFQGLSAAKQYELFMGAHRGVTQELAGGKWLSKFGGMKDARAAVGTIDTPFWLTGKGGATYRFGSGAAGMGMYGLGEVNPFLTNKQTGEKYTLSDTVSHSLSSAAYGGTASLAAPLVGKAMEWTVKKPLEWTVAKPIGWLFNAEANAAGAGLSKLGPGNAWAAANHKFWATTGENWLKAGATRFGVGYGGGFAWGAATHNPWMTKENGEHYTWAESAGHGNKAGLYGGAGMVAAPYLMHGWHGAKNVIGRGGYDKFIQPAFDSSLSVHTQAAYRAGLGGVGGFGYGAISHNPWMKDANGQNYGWNDTLGHGFKWAAIGGAAMAGTAYLQPRVNNWRAAIGKGWESHATPRIEALAATKPATAVTGAATDFARVYGAPTLLLTSDAAGNFYGVAEWGRIDKEAEAILAAARAEEAKKAQQQQEKPAAAAGQPAQPGR